MIKSEDIRIGNYIDVNGIAQVRGVTNGGVWIRNKAFVIMDFKGIPLTPEILENCGYKYREHLRDFYFKPEGTGTIFIISIVHGTFAICASNEKPCLYVHLEDLHKLQNLHYSLLNTELTITI